METIMSEQQSRILSGIDKLLEEQNELFAALPRAIRIAQLWPDAFKDGLTCSPQIVGVSYPRTWCRKPKYPKPYHDLQEITRTYLKRKDGVEHDISTEDFFSIISAGPQ